jgi:hypothetical protein
MCGERERHRIRHRDVALFPALGQGEYQPGSDNAHLAAHMDDLPQEVQILHRQAEDLTLPQAEPGAQVHQDLVRGGQGLAHGLYLPGRPRHDLAAGCGPVVPTTWLKGTTILLDPAGPVYAGIGAGNLRAYADTDTTGHAATGN